MDDSTREKLEKELAERLEDLQNLPIGSEEYLTATKSIAELSNMLSKTLNDDAKFHEMMIKEDLDERRYQDELAQKEIELAESRKSRLISNGIKIGETVLTVGAYFILIMKGFKFEETGTIGSTFFRNVINKIKPGK